MVSSTISSSTSTSTSTSSLVIPGRSGLVVIGNAWGENGNQIGDEETITILSPEFLPDGAIRGIVNKNEVGHLSVTNQGFPVHPIEVLGAMFPMVLIRYTGYNWCMVGGGSVDGVKILVLHDGKVFGIKA